MVWEQGVRELRGSTRSDADSNLVREAQAGAPEAFGELVRRYQDRIYTVICGMVADPEDSRDLTQETFIKAYVGLGRFRQEAGFYTWLYQIAVRHCIDYSRRRKRRQEPALLEECLLRDPGMEPEDTSPSRDPERVIMNLQLRSAIQTALRELPEPFRTAVILRDIEGLSQDAIAKIVRCPLGTAKTRIHRGRSLLREALRPFVQPEN